jgi:hypothetical protein
MNFGNFKLHEPYTIRVLKQLENQKTDLHYFTKQMETWVNNVNDSEYLQ